ncbi:hypothetical protein DPMN_030170 [Dreissena polymorpha]|uniref:Uncharacterized protein n=1 Tax=Dreissena polymorpha TaxID=45954 RepID=A0A9D4RI19_DREPO|nr:hypothetical protein DPMN_030170 [Dreissena polymorpha]
MVYDQLIVEYVLSYISYTKVAENKDKAPCKTLTTWLRSCIRHASVMHRSTSDHMAPTILRSLHGTGRGVDHVALATPRSTSNHMAPAIRWSLPGDVDRVASAMRRSTSDHMAPAILRSLPGNVTGHLMTGPFSGL